MKPQIFDFIVIGGGSGGLASARRAASYGAKVALIESDRLGGTCVIRGCVPKKVTYNLSGIHEIIQKYARRYGYKNYKNVPELDYPVFKQMRDAYVTRLNKIYHGNLERDGVALYEGFGRLKAGPKEQLQDKSVALHVEVVGKDGNVAVELAATRILVATGGRPHVPEDIPGAQEHGITSDGFFELTQVPKYAAIVGGGYIAVEIAGMLRALGSEVHLFVRGENLLRGFDSCLQAELLKHTRKSGIQVHLQTRLKSVVKNKEDEKYTISLSCSDSSKDTEATAAIKWDTVLFATGRVPNSEGLNLPQTVERKENTGYIKVDEYQTTNDPRVFALGDVCGRAELTPVAIAAGRHLSNRLFGGPKYKDARLNYEIIPTVVFSHPPIGTVGLTESQATAKYGKTGQVKVYRSRFINMFYSMVGPDATTPEQMQDKPDTYYKIVTVGEEERVVGIHIIGHSSDEVIQGFAVAVQMGAKKSDLDATIAIHPTAGEELVTMR